MIDGGLDLTSVALLEAIVEIEERLQVRLLDEELSLAALSSLGSLVEHVWEQRR